MYPSSLRSIPRAEMQGKCDAWTNKPNPKVVLQQWTITTKMVIVANHASLIKGGIDVLATALIPLCQPYSSDITKYKNYTMHRMAKLSLLGLLSWYPFIYSSVCNSFEDRPPVDLIYGWPILKWVAVTWIIGIIVPVMVTCSIKTL